MTGLDWDWAGLVEDRGRGWLILDKTELRSGD